MPDLVTKLYRYFLRHTEKLDDHLKLIADEEGADRAVCDYIAGMTDHFAVQMYEDLFIPKSWRKQI